MKTALILRHAKSGWDNMHQPEHERTLTERGRQDAPRMGELILREQLTPDTIVSSTAQRARETAEAVAVTSQFAGEILYDDNLYLAPPQVYLDLLQAMPDAVTVVDQAMMSMSAGTTATASRRSSACRRM